MDRKIIPYIGISVGAVLILIGGGFLYLKEQRLKPTKKTASLTARVVISAVPAASSSSKRTVKSRKRKIAFMYRNSRPKSVYLLGDFNGWKKANPMKRGKNFKWETMLLLSPGKYKYCFLVDGKWKTDPNSKRTVRMKNRKVSLLTIKLLK